MASTKHWAVILLAKCSFIDIYPFKIDFIFLFSKHSTKLKSLTSLKMLMTRNRKRFRLMCLCVIFLHLAIIQCPISVSLVSILYFGSFICDSSHRHCSNDFFIVLWILVSSWGSQRVHSSGIDTFKFPHIMLFAQNKLKTFA